MPAVVIPGAAQLRVFWQLSGVDWAINVYTINNPSAVGINQALANTLGAAIKGFFSSSGFASHVANLVNLNRIGLRDISVANQAEYFDISAVQPGTGAFDLLPLQTALCVTLRTALAGRSYRGRTYLFGLHKNEDAQGGTINSAARTAAVAYVNGIGSALTSSNLQLAVGSRTHTLATPVTNVVSRDANWCAQRRRRSGI